MTTRTPGPWFVSGVRVKMDRSEWHAINRYDEAEKRDQNICCVGFDPRTGAGLADARLIAAVPEMLEVVKIAEAFARSVFERGAQASDENASQLLQLSKAVIAKAGGK